MVQNFIRLLAIALMATLVVSGNTTAGAEDWMQTFTPRRTLYVSPGGAMTGTNIGTEQRPMHLFAAIQTAQPGDLYLLQEGDYPGGWIFNRAGTSDAPIVFRNAPGERARIIGATRMNAPYNWLWGLEITDPRNLAFADGVGVFAGNVRLINNIIHHNCNDNGLGAWDSGEGQVYYGNILYMNGCNPSMTPDGSRLRHPHNVYTQNDFDENGIKYFIANLILDEGCPNNCNGFVAYTENGSISGYNIENNVFANSVVLHGGYAPVTNTLYRHNAFYNATVRFGYRDPTQIQFIGNYLGDSSLSSEWFWAAEAQKQDTNVVIENTFVSLQLRLQTAVVNRNEVPPGTPPLDRRDVWDRNNYLGSFNGEVIADGISQTFDDLRDWRTATGEVGSRFDGDGAMRSAPAEPHVVMIPNAYDPNMTYIAIYNWGNASSVTVNLPGSQVVYEADNLFGSAVAVGANRISIPMSETFGVFVACVWGEGSGGCR